MPLFHSTSGDFSINQYLAPSRRTVNEQEECLQKVQPLIEQPSRPPSPPTKHIFEFPSLLDCLSMQTLHIDMPLQTISSDCGDDFEGVEYLRSEVVFDTASATSALIKTPVDDGENQYETGRDEIDEALLKDNTDVSDTTKVEPYSIDTVIKEARLHFGHEKPEFCIKIPQRHTRAVRLSGGSVMADIRFQFWNEKLGYWELTDGINDSYIVKHSKGNYYVWEGIVRGFSKDPVANVPRRNQRRDSSYQTDSNQLDHDPESTLSSSLRPRTVRQEMPYTWYDVQKRYDNKGLRLSDVELEDVMSGAPSSTAAHGRLRSRKRKQDDTSTVDADTNDRLGSVQSRPSQPFMSNIISDNDLFNNTTLRTCFSGFDCATIPLKAQNCPSSDSFFATIRAKWAFKLASKQILYCVASFPWLSTDKNVLIQESDCDSFSSVMEEVRQAPAWSREGRVEILIEIYTE